MTGANKALLKLTQDSDAALAILKKIKAATFKPKGPS